MQHMAWPLLAADRSHVPMTYRGFPLSPNGFSSPARLIRITH
jgi:hypothetical protein